MYSPSVGVPPRSLRGQHRGCESLRSRECVGEEGSFRIAGVAGPPADLDLLGVPGVTSDEVVCRRLDRLAGEEAHGEVERAPPRVDRGGAAAVWRAERSEHERRSGRGREVRCDLGGLVRGVLVVLVERCRPGRLLWREVDLDGPTESSHGGQDLDGDVRHRPVRRQRYPFDATVRVLDDCLVGPEVEGHHDRPRSVRGRQRQRLPAARRQAKCRMLELGLRRGQSGGQLAEDLSVRMKRLTGRAPGLVWERRPTGHGYPMLEASLWSMLGPMTRCESEHAPGRIRTSDPRIRSPPLCPLSYGRVTVG